MLLIINFVNIGVHYKTKNNKFISISIVKTLKLVMKFNFANCVNETTIACAHLFYGGKIKLALVYLLKVLRNYLYLTGRVKFSRNFIFLSIRNVS